MEVKLAAGQGETREDVVPVSFEERSRKPACCNCGAWRATAAAGSWNSMSASELRLHEVGA